MDALHLALTCNHIKPLVQLSMDSKLITTLNHASVSSRVLTLNDSDWGERNSIPATSSNDFAGV
jgi:hypothetical protein